VTSSLLDTLDETLLGKLKIYEGKDINPDVLREIRDLTRAVIDATLDAHNVVLAENSRQWVANQYFRSIRLSFEHMVDDLVVINDHDLKSLPTRDITTMLAMFNDTVFGNKLSIERKRRKRLQ
jgi:hypothetical protein